MAATLSRALQRTRRLLAYAWASPYTLLGLSIGTLGICLGGRVHRVAGALEFSGGRLGRIAARQRFCAITFGHTILGVCGDTLCEVRAHEQVHVRQYERWGIFFGPAYVLAGLWQGLRGRGFYLDNPFEREAYGNHERSRVG